METPSVVSSEAMEDLSHCDLRTCVPVQSHCFPLLEDLAGSLSTGVVSDKKRVYHNLALRDTHRTPFDEPTLFHSTYDKFSSLVGFRINS